jgi:hypothetical protein
MRRSTTHLTLITLTATLATVPIATRASAGPGFGCLPIFDGGLTAEVCTSAMDGQAQGSLQTFTGTATDITLSLSKCNAAGTTCTVLATSATTQTPAVPSKPGKYYRTCADFVIQLTPSDRRTYSGCSPLVQAPA